MSSTSDDSAASRAELPNAQQVAAFLAANPDFFTAHPEVLRAIDIRHASGGAVSLVERQVTSLREENQRLRTRFHELVTLAQSNQQLITRIHQLALTLMEVAGPRAIFATLGENLKREFDAERVRTLVFAEPGFVENPPLPEFVGVDVIERQLFSQTLDRGEAVCGALAADQFCYLFPDTQHRGSAVLLPLSGNSWNGLLVISSDDESRFNDGMATDFLAYLGDIVSLVIDPWPARSANA